MRGFEWAESNFDVATPHELQSRGVNVYFAPSITPNRKVVDLATGEVDQFAEDQERPGTGYYADFETLEHYCREQGCPLNETDGQVSVQPVGSGRAGDPLRHEGDGRAERS